MRPRLRSVASAHTRLEVLLLTSERPEGGTLQRDEPQTMAALLDEETAPYTELRRGDIIEGVVVGTDRDGILVDIGAKSEGVIPSNEMQCLQPEGPSRLQAGEKGLVFVVQPEAQEGQILLSLARAPRGEVIEPTRRRTRAIVSERAATQEKRAAEKERLLQELHEGDIRTGRITSIRAFGIFVDVGGGAGGWEGGGAVPEEPGAEEPAPEEEAAVEAEAKVAEEEAAVEEEPVAEE